MMVMPSNWSALIVGYWAGRYPGSVGHLYSPGGLRRRPESWLPCALDNGAWGAHLHGHPWREDEWLDHLRRAALSGTDPLWVAVPDVVGDKAATMDLWGRYEGHVSGYGWRRAFVAQDGMTPSDVPAGAEMVFLGGNTEWKWSNLREWGRAFPGKLHVGRVNGYAALVDCYQAGAVSCDGTGWGRGRQKQLGELKRFIEEIWDEDQVMGSARI